jgi:hypothetical protein
MRHSVSSTGRACDSKPNTYMRRLDLQRPVAYIFDASILEVFSHVCTGMSRKRSSLLVIVFKKKNEKQKQKKQKKMLIKRSTCLPAKRLENR